MKPSLGEFEGGSLAFVNLPVLLETRLLVQANSGAGKSWALRRLLEQTAGKVQQLVIDPEGEFSTLRERHDYVIAAAHDGDALAHPRTAQLLATRLLETGVSAILDIYDLKAHERQGFVRTFLETLVNAPKALWHPTLVVLDEAHVFCPEAGKADAAGAVIDLATRGRKRGFCLVAATQRLAKLHKDVAAELLNKLVGRTGLDVDVKRAADELGMTPREAIAQLRSLDSGHFFAFGPALSQRVQRLVVGKVLTSHPKAGERTLRPPPKPTAAIKAVLPKLADLPKEAAKEAATVGELRQEISTLRRQLSQAKVVQQPPTAEQLAAATRSGYQAAAKELRDRVTQAIQGAFDAPPGALTGGQFPQARAESRARHAHAAPIRVMPAAKPAAEPVDGELTGPEKRILDAIAWLELTTGNPICEQTAVAFLAGYTIGGGGFNNPRGRLNQRGLVEYAPGERIRLTDAGRALAAVPESALTVEQLHDRVLARLPGPEQRILRPLLESYPQPMEGEALAVAANYAFGSGGFNNPKGRLRSLGLIEYRQGKVVASSALFPQFRS